jgi:hypothetical protein
VGRTGFVGHGPRRKTTGSRNSGEKELDLPVGSAGFGSTQAQPVNTKIARLEGEMLENRKLVGAS